MHAESTWELAKVGNHNESFDLPACTTARQLILEATEVGGLPIDWSSTIPAR